jgi:tRNA(Ile)-lysidine synthase
MRDALKKQIVESALIPREGHVVVGLSGGPDSVCLLDILLALKEELDFTVSAVHVNHRLRPGDAESDQWYVERLCEDKGVPLVVRVIPVAERAEARGESVEEAGRNARFEVFDEAAMKDRNRHGMDSDRVRIALGHNRDDLVETVIMRLLRGTGPDGLAGIAEMRLSEAGFAIVRPLLGTRRADIEEYCVEQGLFPRHDATNAETHYLRNNVRLELLPLLREKFNPSIDEALLRLSAIAGVDKDYFDRMCTEIMARSCALAEGEIGLVAQMDVDLLRDLHPSVRHRILFRVFEKIGLTQDIGAVHLVAADDLIAKGETGKTAIFPSGFLIEIAYGKAVFRRMDADEADGEDALEGAYAVAVADLVRNDGINRIFEDSVMPMAAVITVSNKPVYGASDEDALHLDYDALLASVSILVLRGRQPGDRISLPGMDGSRKLQDLYVDEKIPREKRASLPVLATEKEVLWAIGLRRTRLFAPNNATKRVLSLTPEAAD